MTTEMTQEVKTQAMRQTLDMFVRVKAEVAVMHPYGIMRGTLRKQEPGMYFVDKPDHGNVHFSASEVSYIDVRLITLK